MSTSKRVFLSDEELGKKYDGPNRYTSTSGSSAMSSWRRLPRRRRITLAILMTLLLLLFVRHKQMQAHNDNTDENPYKPGEQWSQPSYDHYPESSFPDTDDSPDPDGGRYYRGAIEFERLLESLYSSRMWESKTDQEAVVFATGKVKSIGDLLPVACDMALKRRNRVHIMISGKEEASIYSIQQANKFRKEDCPVVWHDARPGHASSLSPRRLALSAKIAMAYIYRALEPRVVITRGIGREESFLLDAIYSKAYQTGTTHIRLPGPMRNYRWIAELDCSSLEAWNDIQTEILIHAPPASSGSLQRLLTSLRDADFLGASPGLTIELPVDVDSTLLKYLKRFRWPPHTKHQHFTLRRRVSPSTMTPEEAAIRVIDSFYPKDPSLSHVLLLSPNTELAPSFFHFLKYSILKYKYCSGEDLPAHLLGISLELPSSRPTDSEPFYPPENMTISTSSKDQPPEIPTLLWQMPNSNAVLYFGDKWLEFQSFLANRFSPSIKAKQKDMPKIIQKLFPSWMDYMLEFMRARGYYLTYPAFASANGLTLATVHNELYKPPEEYDDLKRPQVRSNFKEEDLDHSPSTLSVLLDVYPGNLPNIRNLPVLPYVAEVGEDVDFEDKQNAFIRTFRHDVGGCADDHDRILDVVPLSADDLFCVED